MFIVKKKKKSLLLCVDLVQEGRTALHYAAMNENAEFCKKLVEMGADVDAVDKVR